MNTSSRPSRPSGFTLVELLVVMSVIALLAAMIFAASVVAKRPAMLQVAQSELGQVKTALDNYHTQYGAYPPGDPLNAALNPLYYELIGVTNTAGNYQTLDSASSVNINSYDATFNVNGVMNCAKTGGDQEVGRPQNFLLGLKQTRIGTYGGFNILVTSVGGPDNSHLMALQAQGFTGNPICYSYPGTNNPTAYDLWVDLVINGKTYHLTE